jgi:hypothetical protein
MRIAPPNLDPEDRTIPAKTTPLSLPEKRGFIFLDLNHAVRAVFIKMENQENSNPGKN